MNKFRLLGNITDGVQPRVARIIKYYAVSNKAALRKFLTELASDEHELLIPCHGNPVIGDLQKKLKIAADSF